MAEQIVHSSGTCVSLLMNAVNPMLFTGDLENRLHGPGNIPSDWITHTYDVGYERVGVELKGADT
jgi:hypothetical protein